jgi:hypothetical protein
MDASNFQRNPKGYTYTLCMTAFVVLHLIFNVIIWVMAIAEDKLLAAIIILLLQCPQTIYMLIILRKPDFLYSKYAAGKLGMSIVFTLLNFLIVLFTGLSGKLDMSIVFTSLNFLIVIFTGLLISHHPINHNDNGLGSPIIAVITSLIFLGGQTMMLVTFIGYMMAERPGNKLAWMLPYTVGGSYGSSNYRMSSHGGDGYGGAYGQQQQ